MWLVELMDEKIFKTKLMEFELWTNNSAKYMELIIKWSVFVISVSGLVLVYNLNKNLVYPINLSLLFVSVLCFITFIIFVWPACYLNSSCKNMNDLAHDLDTYLVPTLNAVQSILVCLSVLFLLLGVVFALLFFNKELFGLLESVSFSPDCFANG